MRQKWSKWDREQGGVRKISYYFETPMDLATAIEMSIDLWEVMAETGDNYKPETNLSSDCPLCEYGGPPNYLDCQRCPVEWIDGVRPNPLYACLHGINERVRSPTLYALWMIAESKEERQERSADIVAELRRILKEVQK